MGGWYTKRLAPKEFDAFLKSNTFIKSPLRVRESVTDIFNHIKSLKQNDVFVELKITYLIMGIKGVLEIHGKKHYRWTNEKVQACQQPIPPEEQ